MIKSHLRQARIEFNTLKQCYRNNQLLSRQSEPVELSFNYSKIEKTLYC